jgi:hypothetical protein
MNSVQPQQYFEKIIAGYIKGDIEELLASESNRSGPLLACVVNGIDAMGGVTQGFKEGSCARSVKFMMQYMGVNEQQARLIYVVARCGLAHEGVPKPGLRFFVAYESHGLQDILYRDQSGVLWLDVIRLARVFLRAVHDVSERPRVLKNVPPIDERAEDAFSDVAATVNTNIDDLCKAIQGARDSEEEAKFTRGELDERSSSSPVLPSHLPAMILSTTNE